jgi:GDP-L-fucose synthase
MAEACVFVMQQVDFKDLTGDRQEVRNAHLNIGTGHDISIKDLANLIKKHLGFQGEFVFREDRPDGTMKKLTDVKKLNDLGWEYTVTLENGIERMYKWYDSPS